MNTQTVNLDVTKRPSVLPAIYIGQGDMNGTTLVANIYDDGTAFTLDNYGVRFRMKLPYSVATYYVDGTVSGSAATFAIDEAYAASVAGVTDTAYVEVLDGDTVVCSTNRMRVVVLESAYEGVPPAHIWDNGITQFLADAQDAVDAAVDDADAATTRATQAAEAAEGVILDVIPTMTENIKGGAKVGSGLEIDSDTLSIDLTDEATGESVTAADASYLASLTVDGKAVQDGTPTPSAPVDVQVVKSPNLLDLTGGMHTVSGVTFASEPYSTVRVSGTSTADWAATTRVFIPASPSTTYTITLDKIPSDYYNGMYMSVWEADASQVNIVETLFCSWAAANNVTTKTINTAANTAYFRITIGVRNANTTINAVINAQIIEGSTATPYTPYGSIGLKVGSNITPIDLNGNVLASLPDGTKDVLTVDSVGHYEIEKHIGYITSYNGESVGDNYISTTGELSEGASVYYELAAAQTIDCGYIDMPAIPDGSQISITAQVTPTISASWWARGAAAIVEALKAVRARLQAIEAAIAELATA